MTAFFLKNSLKYIILSFLILALSSFLAGQEYQLVVNRLSFEDGLSSRKVKDVCQDTFGFIWIATENGLNRYDGHSFKQYFSDGSNLRNNHIDEIYADEQGQVWCIRHKNYKNARIKNMEMADNFLIDIFDPQTESFQSFDSLSNTIREKDISSFHKAIDGRLYFSTEDGKIFSSSDLSEPFVSLPKDRPFFNFIFVEDGIWTNGIKQLSRYSFRGQLLEEENIDIQPLQLQYRDENSMWVIPLIISFTSYPCWKMYVKYNHQALRLYELSLEDKSIHGWRERRIMATIENQLEVHIHQGICYLYDLESKRVIQEHTLKVSSIDYLPFVEQLFKDRTGMIWIATSFGVFNIGVIDQKFKTILEGKSTRSIFQLNEDSLIIFTYDGTFIQHIENDQVRRLKDPRIEKARWGGITKNHEGYFFIGGHSHMIIKMNAHGKTVDAFFDSHDVRMKSAYPTPPYVYLYITPYFNPEDNRVWLASGNGLFILNELARKKEPFLDNKGREVFTGKDIRELTFDESGMWVITSSGFYLVDEEKKVTEIFWNNKPVHIRNMYKDADGIRWLVVLDNGILRWDVLADEMIHLNANNGLSNNNIYIIYEDDFGYLWLPSDYGLMRMNKKDFSVQTFLTEDGIAHNEFNHTSHFKSQKGEFYFGGLSGVTYFDPADFVQESIIDNMPIVTSLRFVKKGEEEQEDRTALLRREQMIKLNTQDQSFVLEMTIPNYQNPKNQYFAYQIAGLENTWTEVKENFIRINRLPYGDYNILLKARYLGGQWSNKVLDIPLHVARPIYLKPWFLGLVILAVLGLIGLAIHWRLAWLEKDKERLEKEVESRTQKIEEQKVELEALNQTKDQFFAIIAHDLRGPVISFRGLSKKVNFLIRKKQIERLNELGDSIDNTASNLEKLLDNLLNWALIQNGSLPFHPKIIFVQPLIEETLMVFQGLYESKSITIETEVDETLSIYADINGLSAIIRNLLSNAIKYSAEGSSILLSARKKEQYALIEFIDHGVGMPDELIHTALHNKAQYISSNQGTKGEKGTGLGLQLCKELVELHKGKIEIWNNKSGQGLTVRVQLPVNKI